LAAGRRCNSTWQRRLTKSPMRCYIFSTTSVLDGTRGDGEEMLGESKSTSATVCAPARYPGVYSFVVCMAAFLGYE
jgi:hypothetical protein